MTTDLLPPQNEPPAPDPEPAPRAGSRVSCGFCGSRLAANGDVMSLGAEAKAFRDAEDTITRLNKQIEKLTTDLDTVTRERNEARTTAEELARQSSKGSDIRW